jgi:hypothetical protein
MTSIQRNGAFLPRLIVLSVKELAAQHVELEGVV